MAISIGSILPTDNHTNVSAVIAIVSFSRGSLRRECYFKGSSVLKIEKGWSSRIFSASGCVGFLCPLLRTVVKSADPLQNYRTHDQQKEPQYKTGEVGIQHIQKYWMYKVLLQEYSFNRAKVSRMGSRTVAF